MDYTLTMADSKDREDTTTTEGDTVSQPAATVIDTPAGIQNFMWLRFMHMLALDLNTGMGHSGGPILRQMHRAGMIDAELRGTRKNKIMVLEAMVEQMKEAVKDYTPSASITRALGGKN